MLFFRNDHEVKEIVKIYNDIVNELCDLFMTLGIQNNPVATYETFRYMYTNNYLSSSKYKSIVPDYIQTIEQKAIIPLDICGCILPVGYGICRHTTDFLRYIYTYLGYDNSQLFVYSPKLYIDILHEGISLTKEEAQKYIDEAIACIDLCSKQSIYFEKQFGPIRVVIDYTSYTKKSPNLPANHTMNIVMDREKNLVHILDTHTHGVGEIEDGKKVITNRDGLKNIAILMSKKDHIRYYDTDYSRGIVLSKYDTDIEQDIKDSILYCSLCSERQDSYHTFWDRNHEKYATINRHLKRIRR